MAVIRGCRGRLLRRWDGRNGQTHDFPQREFDPAAVIRVLLQELARIFPALAETSALEREPRAALFDNILIDGKIQDVAFARDAFAIHDVEFSFTKRRSNFVLNNLRLRPATDNVLTVLDGGDSSNIHANRGVKLQRAATGGCLRISEHDADFFADLVDEHQACFGFGNDAGQLAQRLRHQSRLQSHLRIAHLAFEFGARDEGSNRIDDDNVDGAAADQDFRDFQRLLAAVRLRDQQVLDVDAELARVICVESMFRVYKCRGSAKFLRFSDHVKSKRGFTAGFRSEDFNDAAAWKSADAESGIE